MHVNIRIMRLKRLNTIFYPFDTVLAYEGVLLVRESTRLEGDGASWAAKIERAFDVWLQWPGRLVSIGDNSSWQESIGFYHSIYNQVYLEEVGISGKLSFGKQVDRMVEMAGGKEAVSFVF